MVNQNTKGRGTAWYFEDWVFRKTNPNYHHDEHTSTTIERKKLGQFGHQDSDNMQFWMNRGKALQEITSNFELFYSDPHDGSENRVFNASRLIVDGKPMRCRPVQAISGIKDIKVIMEHCAYSTVEGQQKVLEITRI